MLFVISVLVSQSLMDLFSTLLCGQWIWMVWNRRKAETPKPALLHPFGLEKVWIAWLVVAIVGFLLNPMDLPYALSRVIEYKWILILYVLIEALELLKPNRQILNFILGFLCVISATNIFLFLADWPIFDSLRYGVGENGFLRAGGFFADPMTFAHSYVLFFCFLLGVFLLDQARWTSRQRLMAFVVIGLSAAGLYWTYTRGVWIGLTCAMVICFFIWRPWVAIVFSVLVCCCGLLLYQSNKDFGTRMDQTISEYQGYSERKVLWNTHWQIFKDHPFFGAGYGQNTKMLPQYFIKMGAPEGIIVSHAHNQYLHLAAGTGILGLGIYLLVWGFFFYLLIRLWRHPGIETWDRGVTLGFLMAQVAFCVGSLTEANFEHSKVRFVVMLIWAYVIFLARKYNCLSVGRKVS